MARRGLQRIPLIGRKFAKTESGIYVPQQEKKPPPSFVKGEAPTFVERPIVTPDTAKSHESGKAKRRAESKRARKARRKNRRRH